MAIRKASRQYNSDYMSRLCDDELEQLEERLTALYANATNDVLSDYDKWMSHYKANYNEMCAKLEAGEISQKDFKEWVDRRMIDDKLFAETVNSMTDVLVNTDLVAMALVNDELPLIIAQSYNFVQSLGFAAADEAGLSVGTFQIYNARTVQALIKDNPDILKYVNKENDYTFNKERINNTITHSILNGDSIQKTANRLQGVSSMDENSAIRTARTAMTAAENMGRNESYHDLKEKGIPARLQWSATHDNRTRDLHILLDGQYQDEDGKFRVEGYEIQFPGDPAAEPEMIWNCRCRASLRLEGVDHSQDGDMYEKFMKDNYPDDWEKIKDGIEKKEEAFQKNKEGAAERVKEKSTTNQEKENQKPQAQSTVDKDEPTVTDTDIAISSAEPTITAIEESSSFVPAKTIAEAENYAESHYVEGGLGRFTNAGKDVSFRGIDVEVANAINHRLTTIYENFRIQPITTLETYGKRDKRIFAKDGEALMCTSPFGNIGINSTFLSSMQTIGSYTEEGRKAFDYVVENIESLSGMQRAFAEACKTAGRQVVDDSVEGYITHEIGHLLSFGDSNSALGDISKNTDWEGYAAQLSGYATTSFGEYVAESFVAYFNGEVDKMQPEMVSLFDSLRRKDNG